MRKTVDNIADITVIGAAVMDVLAGAVSPEVFEIGSMPMDYIKCSFGGDALNESVVLSRLGRKTELITKLGSDDAGKRTLDFICENGVITKDVVITKEFPSSVNIVLVDKEGERFFLTDPGSCLRKLSEEDIVPHIGGMADLVSFASIFVSPLLGMNELERIFKKIKEPSGKGEGASSRRLLTDVTKPKKGETLKDIKQVLPYIDYFLANEEEISMLTGTKDPFESADRFIEEGASCIVIKRGVNGCIIKTESELHDIPAFPVKKVIDTTGAGDGFAAGFLYGLSEGFSIEDCGIVGNALASCIIEKVGGTDGIESLEEPMERFKVLKERVSK